VRTTVLIVFGNVIATGLLIGAVVVLRREIRQRRAAEWHAQRSAEEIEDLYNHAPCGYHSLDANGVFVRINDTELSWLGYSREEMLGKIRFADILSPRSAERFEKGFPRFRSTGYVRDLEFDLVRTDRCATGRHVRNGQ
jgi:PAS domain S-box-containing protein